MSLNENHHSSLSIEKSAIDSVSKAEPQDKGDSSVPKDADTERARLTTADTAASSRQTPSEARGLDLSVEADVISYLASTPFASTNVKALSGGNSNFVYRLTLAQPYKGHTALVLKHAKGWVKTSPTFALHIERQKYEVAALRHVFAWLPRDWIVRVPEVHLFDEVENVIIMDDTGEESIHLKEYLQKGLASPEIAKVIGTELGKFLAGLHSWGKSNDAVREAVSGNVQGKAIKGMYYYGGLKATLEGPSDIPYLTNPPLDMAQEDMRAIEQLSAETKKVILNAKGVFVMGDFWPGNIMINVQDGCLKQVVVVDWELAKEGIPGIDVGQLCAELHLLRRCDPETCEETATVVLENFVQKYKEDYNPSAEDWQRAISQIGAHMITLGGRVKWGDRDVTRMIVLEGVRILVDGRFHNWDNDLICNQSINNK